jgi:hypothetical protein
MTPAPFRFKSNNLNAALDGLTSILDDAAATLPGLNYSRHFCGGEDSRMWFELSYGKDTERVPVDLSGHYMYIQSDVRTAILHLVLRAPWSVRWPGSVLH